MRNQPDFRIRNLSESDIDDMRSLLRVFGDVFEEEATYCSAQPGSAYLQRLLGREGFIALVAVKKGQVVGGLTAYVFQKYEQERSEIYIYDLAVLADHRRQGIATALIEQLRQIGTRRDGYVIIVQADKGDDPAIALYSKLGVREDILHFDIAIKKQA